LVNKTKTKNATKNLMMNFITKNASKRYAFVVQLGFQVAVSDFYLKGGVAAKSW
jgi:hypothetical protein